MNSEVRYLTLGRLTAEFRGARQWLGTRAGTTCSSMPPDRPRPSTLWLPARCMCLLGDYLARFITSTRFLASASVGTASSTRSASVTAVSSIWLRAHFPLASLTYCVPYHWGFFCLSKSRSQDAAFSHLALRSSGSREAAIVA